MKDVLQVAARSGSGSAARALGSGLAGIPSRTKRLAIAAGAILFVIYLGWDMLSGMSGGTQAVGPVSLASASPDASPTIAVTPVTRSGRAGYWMDLSEVSGLSPNTPAGTTVDLWVAWDPPLTKRPKIQHLLSDVVIADIAPPIVPEGPTGVMFSVTRKGRDDLLWADRYGSISATIGDPLP